MRDGMQAIWAAGVAIVLVFGTTASRAQDGRHVVFNLPELSAADSTKLHELIPLLTLGGQLENTGSASHPVLCFTYTDADRARGIVADMADVYDAAGLAKAAYVGESCDLQD